MKKMKLDHLLTPYIRIKSKWIKYLNVRHKTIKLLEKNTGSKLSDIAFSNIFSDISPQARETKETIHKWYYIKLKRLHAGKKTVNKTKRQCTYREKIFTNDISNKRLISKIHKELIQLNTKKSNHPNWEKKKKSTKPE